MLMMTTTLTFMQYKSAAAIFNARYSSETWPKITLHIEKGEIEFKIANYENFFDDNFFHI